MGGSYVSPRGDGSWPGGHQFRALTWRWPVVLLVALPVVFAALLYADRSPVERSVETVLSVVPQAGKETSGDLIRLAVPRYAVLLTSSTTFAEVAADSGVPASELAGAVSIATSAETANLTVTVRDQSPDRALLIADAIAATAVELGGDDLAVDVAVIASATVMSEPTLTPDAMLLLLAVVFGLALGVGVALLVERVWPRVGSLAEVARVTGARVSSIPQSASLRRQGARVRPEVAHAVGLLREALTVEPTAKASIVAVVAPARGIGASTVASLVTGSLAAGGSSVCLIDADLEVPSLAKSYRLTPSPGLAELLEGSATMESASRSFEPEGAVVIPTVRVDGAGEHLSRGLGASLEKARQNRSLVLVDCGPLLGEDDAAGVVAARADSVLLVIELRTSMSDLLESVALLRYLDVPLLGVVVNRCSRRGTRGTRSRDPGVETGHSRAQAVDQQ